MLFSKHFVTQKEKTSIKTLITGEIYISNYPHSLVVDSTSRLIHFLCVFVIRKGRYGQICDYYSILLPKKFNAHKNLNHW